MRFNSVYEALDILDDFMDEIDELYGLCTFTYGDDAYDAIEYVHMWRMEELKKQINARERKKKSAGNNVDKSIDKIAAFLEQDENWKALKECWRIGGRSDDLRKLLKSAIMEE